MSVRKRYFLSFNMDKPHEQAAYMTLMEIPAKQRSEYVIDAILKMEAEHSLEEMLRTILQEELGRVAFAAPAAAAPTELVATKDARDLPDDLLAMIESL